MLHVQGRCAEALTFYAEVGGTDLRVMTHAEAPEGERPPGDALDRVMHSQLSTGPGAFLFGMDMPEGMPSPGPGRVSVFHAAPTPDRARAVFDALAQGGSVSMPLGRSFWSEGFGLVTDRWGTSWMISVQPAEPGLAEGGA